LISEHKKGWNFKQRSFINSLKNRGFAADGNDSIVSGYFWEEDGVKLWNTLYTFVKKVNSRTKTESERNQSQTKPQSI
jgi:hypothetical protein